MHPSMIGKVSLASEEEACPGCATIARYQRALADRDEQHRQAHPKGKPSDPLPSDGLHVHLRTLTPQEAIARASKSKGVR
jgi:hypothetical protein